MRLRLQEGTARGRSQEQLLPGVTPARGLRGGRGAARPRRAQASVLLSRGEHLPPHPPPQRNRQSQAGAPAAPRPPPSYPEAAPPLWGLLASAHPGHICPQRFRCGDVSPTATQRELVSPPSPHRWVPCYHRDPWRRPPLRLRSCDAATALLLKPSSSARQRHFLRGRPLSAPGAGWACLRPRQASCWEGSPPTTEGPQQPPEPTPGRWAPRPGLPCPRHTLERPCPGPAVPLPGISAFSGTVGVSAPVPWERRSWGGWALRGTWPGWGEGRVGERSGGWAGGLVAHHHDRVPGGALVRGPRPVRQQRL